MASNKLTGLLAKLAQVSKPTFVNGRWRKPELGARKLAEVKRSLRAQGVPVPLEPLQDRSKDKPFKLPKWERNREARQTMIKDNMRQMPEMVADHRKKVIELRQKTRKTETEEEEYLLATGKSRQEKPVWEVFKDKKVSKKKSK